MTSSVARRAIRMPSVTRLRSHRLRPSWAHRPPNTLSMPISESSCRPCSRTSVMPSTVAWAQKSWDSARGPAGYWRWRWEVTAGVLAVDQKGTSFRRIRRLLNARLDVRFVGRPLRFETWLVRQEEVQKPDDLPVAEPVGARCRWGAGLSWQVLRFLDRSH